MRLTLLIACFFLTTNAFAQSARPEVRAHRLVENETIVIDGAPDEAVWQKAVPAANFLQRDPGNGAAATSIGEAQQKIVRTIRF